jgi:hypothetical protein
MAKITVSIDPDNKDIEKAKEIGEELDNVRRREFEYFLFLLALLSTIILNLFSSYVDAFIRRYLPSYYLLFQIIIFGFGLLVICLIVFIVVRYIRTERKFETEFYKIYQNNPKKKYFKIGEQISGENWEYKVIKYYFKKTVKDKYQIRKSEGKYMIFEIELKNTSERMFEYNMYHFNIFDVNNNKYDVDNYSTIRLREIKKIEYEKFMPNKKYKIILSFDVPVKSEIKYFIFRDEKYSIIDLTKHT